MNAPSPAGPSPAGPSPYAPPGFHGGLTPRVPATYKPLGWKTTATTLAIAASIVATLLVVLLGVMSVRAPPNERLAIFVVLGLVSILQNAAAMLGAVLFLMWIHHASKNAHSLGRDGLEYTPGWSVAWWFVPVLGLWKPYQVVAEIWRASDPTAAAANDAFDTSWRKRNVSALLPVWWATYLLSGFIGFAGLTLIVQSAAHRVVGVTIPAAVAFATSLVLSIACATLLDVMMRAIDRRQQITRQRLDDPDDA